MNKCLIVCLLSVAPLMMYSAEKSADSRRNSDKVRKALSQQLIVVKQQENKLAQSDPIKIPKKQEKYLVKLAASPKKDGDEFSFNDYTSLYNQSYSPSPYDYNSTR